MREVDFQNREFYHIYNRGTDRRDLFVDDLDHERFLDSVYLFNDEHYTHQPDPFHKITLLASSEAEVNFQKPFLRIHAYCLMPNHYHFLVEQLEEKGISRFFHKLDMGYSRYFNRRYKRTGTLYEGPFKAIHVKDESYLRHLPLYIHLNPLELSGANWKDGVVEDWGAAEEFLSGYSWSSHHAFLGREQRLPIINSGLGVDDYQDEVDYLNHLKNWSRRDLINLLPNFS